MQRDWGRFRVGVSCPGEVTVRASTAVQWQGEVKANPMAKTSLRAMILDYLFNPTSSHTLLVYYVLATDAFLFFKPTEPAPAMDSLHLWSHCLTACPLPWCLNSLTSGDVSSKHLPQKLFPDHLTQPGLSLPPSNPLPLFFICISLISTRRFLVSLFVYSLSMSSSVKCKLWGLHLLFYFWFTMFKPEPESLKECNTRLLTKWMRTTLSTL